MAILKTLLRSGFTSLILLIFCNHLSAQDAPSPVEKMVQEANDRIAGGESQESVEQTLRSGFDEQGLKTQTAPPSWDVFARSRWENNEAPDKNKSRHGHKPLTSEPPTFVIGGTHAAE